MSNNRRVFYAIQQVGFAQDGSTTYVAAHGVRTAGITTTFAIENIFEMGQLLPYDLIEQVPDVELTLEKQLDGYPLLYHLATSGSTVPGLIGRSNAKCSVALSIFPDTDLSASGNPVAEVIMSGLQVTSLAYAFGNDGSATESLTAVCQSKLWRDTTASGVNAFFSGAFSTLDSPYGTGYAAGDTAQHVQQRWNFLWAPISGSPTGVDANGATNAYCSVLPRDIPGVSSSGTNPVDAANGNAFVVPVTSINVSADLNRDPVYELGKKSYYGRFVSWPVEVRTEIETLSTGGDRISGTEAGGNNGAAAGSNLAYQTIRVQMEEGTRIDLGTRNKLTSVAESGGDATSGGGNVTTRYSYVTFNHLDVFHPQDPSALSG